MRFAFLAVERADGQDWGPVRRPGEGLPCSILSMYESEKRATSEEDSGRKPPNRWPLCATSSVSVIASGVPKQPTLNTRHLARGTH